MFSNSLRFYTRVVALFFSLQSAQAFELKNTEWVIARGVSRSLISAFEALKQELPVTLRERVPADLLSSTLIGTAPELCVVLMPGGWSELKALYVSGLDQNTSDSIFSGAFSLCGAGKSVLILSDSIEDHGELRTLFFHELFHFFHHQFQPHEESWVKEGLAQVFASRVTGILPFAAIHAALRGESTPLMRSHDWRHPSLALYGHQFLYFWKTIRDCGGDDFFWSWVKRPQSSADLIFSSQARGSIEICSSFLNSVMDFERKRYEVSGLSTMPLRELGITVGVFPSFSESKMESFDSMERFQPVVMSLSRRMLFHFERDPRFWIREMPEMLNREGEPLAHSQKTLLMKIRD